MKRKYFITLFVMAVTAVLSLALTACGDDDNGSSQSSYVPSGGEAGNILLGVHRIDVEYSGNTGGCDATSAIYAVKADASPSALYTNGNQMNLDEETHSWKNFNFDNVSVQSEDNCRLAALSVIITSRNLKPATAEVTATVSGYVNNKLIKRETFTLPVGKSSMGFVFNTVSNEQSYQYFN